MSAPRFSAATIAALARYAEARRNCIDSRRRGWIPSAKEFDLARFTLESALDADWERAQSPRRALPTEGEPGPFRFGGAR